MSSRHLAFSAHRLRAGYYITKIATAKSLQSCPTLCDSIDGSPLGSSVPGILQARILEWVAIFFSNGRLNGFCAGDAVWGGGGGAPVGTMSHVAGKTSQKR